MGLAGTLADSMESSHVQDVVVAVVGVEVGVSVVASHMVGTPVNQNTWNNLIILKWNRIDILLKYYVDRT